MKKEFLMMNKWISALTLLSFIFIMSCDALITEEDDTENPTVTISSPSNNEQYEQGYLLYIVAEATDNEGIKEVNFYIDEQLVNTDDSAPYEYEWNTAGLAGNHSIKVGAVDVNDNSSDFQSIAITIYEADNTMPPVAEASVSQAVGNFTTIFQFDASASSDNEDDVSLLQVRWDWENDGTWDTDYSLTKTATHQFSSTGFFWVKAGVVDTHGKTDDFLVPLNIISNEMGTVTDVDGNVYQTAKIGNQWWMVENLKTTHYRNGDAIPDVTDGSAWGNLTSGARSESDLADALKHVGLLYNYYAVSDSRNLAPSGWHVPTDAEWKELEMHLGMSQAEADADDFRGTDEGKKLRAAGGFHAWGSIDNTANASGFTALPGGVRGLDGSFDYDSAWFWTSTEAENSAWIRWLFNYIPDQIGRSVDDASGNSLKNYGMSIRLVKD